MGKIKRTKQRLHSSAPKTTGEKKKPETKEEENSQLVMPQTMFTLPGADGLFRGLKIDKEALAQKLPDFDTRSVITSKSLKGLQLKKKEKKKLRHELWMQKMDAIQTAKRKEKEKKKRQKTPIVGDMSMMEEALPTLELLLKESDAKARKKERQVKPRSIPKQKQRQKQMMSDVTIFKQVLDHPAFKGNPASTISEHLRNKLKQEEEMET